MKNHEYVHSVNDVIASGIYRINPNEFPEMFAIQGKHICRNWTFRPVYASDKVVLIDTYYGFEGIEVTDEMLKKDVIEFVCNSDDYVDLGTDPQRVENYRQDNYEVVSLDSGEPHYLLTKDATEDREVNLTT